MIEEITNPPFLDDTAQEMVTKLQAIANNINNNAGQVSYSNTTSQLQAETVQTAIDEVKGITDTISASLTQLARIQTASTPAPIAVNGTYQIPSNVLNCSLIAVEARRYGEGNCSVFLKSSLLYFDNGFTLNATPTEGYTLTCSTTGLLTLISKSSRLGDPNIVVYGIL